MVKCGVLFEVRTEFLNVTYTRKLCSFFLSLGFGFKGLKEENRVTVFANRMLRRG
jgi:hypothetical protein